MLGTSFFNTLNTTNRSLRAITHSPKGQGQSCNFLNCWVPVLSLKRAKLRILNLLTQIDGDDDKYCN